MNLDLFEAPAPGGAPRAEGFDVPPTSVLDARTGPWQERKAAWLARGIQGEVGRPVGLTWRWGPAGWPERKALPPGRRAPSLEDIAPGTSVFDPVLTECAYRWFCPPGGQVVDPFAGGSVRGVVAALLGRRYWGCDLRPEQIAANEQQAEEICPGSIRPTWVCGDALAVLPQAPLADLVFTCPPYGDLERYSDDPRDLSTMSDYAVFLATFRRVMASCVARLLAGGFVALVIGDFRDKRTGLYQGFVADTVRLFRDLGLGLYHDAVLLPSVGSLSLRAGGYFAATRKLGKGHQNVLVFTGTEPIA